MSQEIKTVTKDNDSTERDNVRQRETEQPSEVRLFDKLALTYREAAAMIGVTESALRQMVWRKEITCKRPSKRRVRFTREDIEAWLKKGATDV